MSKLILRIILSPFIFLYGIFLLAAGTLFPLPLLVVLSFYGLISIPIIWLLNKSGVEVNQMDNAFISYSNSQALNHFLGLTIYFWGAFYVVYMFIKKGELAFVND